MATCKLKNPKYEWFLFTWCVVIIIDFYLHKPVLKKVNCLVKNEGFLYYQSNFFIVDLVDQQSTQLLGNPLSHVLLY